MTKNESRHTTVGVVSLGCAKNLVDSENLLGMLRDRGYEIVADPAEVSHSFRLNYSMPSDEEIDRGIKILADIAGEMLSEGRS